MLFKNIQKTKVSDWGYFLVVALGFILSMRHLTSTTPPKDPTVLAVPAQFMANRTLASTSNAIVTTGKHENKEDKYLRAISIPCAARVNSEAKIEVDTPFLRLNFFDCPKEMGSKSFSVHFQNLSTSENILLFTDEFEKKITTNYFPLQEGDNHLKLDFLQGTYIVGSKMITAKRPSN